MTPVAIVTGSGGLVGSESVATSSRPASTSSGSRTTCGRASSGRGVDRARRPSDCSPSYASAFGRSRSTSATPTAWTRLFAEHAKQLELVIHTAAQPSHDWAASDPQTDFAVNANGTLNLLEATRDARARRDVHLHVDQQGLRRSSERPAAGRARDAARARPRITLLPRHRHVDVDRPRRLHSLFGVSKAAADLLVQEYGRYFDMPTGVLPRRLPDGPEPRGRAAARLPLLPDALHGHRRAVHVLRLRAASRCATTSTATTWSRAFAAFHASRGPVRSTTSAAGAKATARCSRRSRCASRSRAASSSGRCANDARDRRSPMVDQRSAAVPPRLSGLEHEVRRGRDPRRHLHRERGCVVDGGLRYSIVIPARNEAGTIGTTLSLLAAELDAATIDYEILVIDDASTDDTRAVVVPTARGEPAHPVPSLAQSARLRLRDPRRSRVVRRRRGRDRDGRRLGQPRRRDRLHPRPRRGIRLRVWVSVHERRLGASTTRGRSSC